MGWENWKKKADSVCKVLRRYEGFENCNVGCIVLESGETQWTVYIGKSVMKFTSGSDVNPKALAEYINKRMKHHLNRSNISPIDVLSDHYYEFD